MSLTLVTWNLKGSKGLDVRAVADHIRAVGADVVVLQEVQRRQAAALAGELEAASLGWGFKHWPVSVAAEGMAVIGVSRAAEARTHALSYRFRFWSWRRRIFQTATIEADGRRLLVVNVHLSPKRQAERRAREVAAVLAVVGSVTNGANGPTGATGATGAIVAGDLNDRPDAAIFTMLAEAGLRDAWTERHPNASEAEAATNWRGWTPGTTAAPDQRLDYVLVPEDVGVQAVLLPRYGQAGFAPFASLSDHLPVTATLVVDGSTPTW